MSSITISFYGQLAEAFGRELELAVAPGTSVADVRRRLIDRDPDAAPILGREAVRACLDDRIVDDDAAIPAGAALAFLPPLSGG